MTLEEMRTLVTSVTGVTVTSTIDRYLNKAMLNLAEESKRFKRADVVVNVNGYFNQPTGCLVVNKVYHNDKPLREYIYDNIPTAISGTPKYYILDEIDVEGVITPIIRLHPVPNYNLTSQVVYIKRPATMTQTTDTPELADSEEYLVAYAVWKILANSGLIDDEDTVDWKNVAEHEKINWLKTDRRKNSHAHHIRIS